FDPTGNRRLPQGNLAALARRTVRSIVRGTCGTWGRSSIPEPAGPRGQSRPAGRFTVLKRH
ncbi:MAG: hypothetical protein WBL43_04605, partial [Pseudolabrys sp.]